MKYAIIIAEDGRILSATFKQYAPTNSIIVDTIPDGKLPDYLYVDGQYVYDPLPVSEETEIPDTPAEDDDVWAALDAAYQEGVDSV